MGILREDSIKKVTDSLVDQLMNLAECIILVDHSTGKYEMIKSNDFFLSIIKEKGTSEELFKVLYLSSRDKNKSFVSEYEEFVELSVFEKNEYRADFYFENDGKKYLSTMYQVRMSPTEVALLFAKRDEHSLSKDLEVEKADTIQESYLYSMIVDLAEDNCINPNTTEVSSDRQDYMNIQYSQWRLKICNMFKEQDKTLFLRASAPENVINTLEDKAKFHLDIQMMNMQGTFIWVRLGFARMKNFSRENPRFLYTVEDISEDMDQLLKQEGLTKAVEEQNQNLQKAEQERTLLFASMSHEIRTPINAIMGMNEIILRDTKDDNIKSYAQDIKDASRLLLNLVNDILDFSKIEAGRMEIIPTEYRLEEMLRSICNLMKGKMEAKYLDFELNIGENVPSVLYGDEIRISQILINIMTNAIKYTDNGKVSLSVEYTQDGDGNDAIRYCVEDTGIGIKEEDIKKLFGSYERFDLERNRRVEGTGLGMGIVNGLLSAMNSHLEVSSVYGKGSIFSFTLAQKVIDYTPINTGLKDNSLKNKEEKIFYEKRALLVDDVLINLKVGELILKRFIKHVDVAHSGKEALHMIADKDYDIVAIDFMMPEMDGEEVMKSIKAMGGKYESIPIVVLTGDYSVTARDEYMSMGFTDYLEKPLMPEELAAVLKKIW